MKIILFFFLLCLSANIFAQAPDLINYQALAYDGSGNTIKNTAISIRVTILESSSSGTIAYQETHNPGTDANGAFDIRIGGGSPQQGTFSSIDWGAHSHYLRIEMDAAGGSSYTIMGTSQMVSVPYAQYAKKAGSVGGNVSSEIINKVFRTTSNSFSYVPLGCDTSTNTSSTIYSFLAVESASGTANKVIAVDGYIINDFTYTPSTLAINSVSINTNNTGSITFDSGSISSDFSAITVRLNLVNPGGSLATCTDVDLIYFRQ